MIRTIALSASLLLVLCPKVTLAWLRPTYEDATVVERSELIVVAHLKEGSIQKVPPRKEAHRRAQVQNTMRRSHHYQGAERGKPRPLEIPVVIHYGLTPVAAVRKKRQLS